MIKINEQYGSVIIKCGSLYLKNGAKFTFDSPFKNRCLGVFVTDISTSNTTIYHHAVKNVNVSGFDFFTTYNLITNQILVEKIKIQGKGTGIIGWQTIEIKLSKIKTILGVSAVPIRSQSQIDFLSYSITSIKYRVYSSSGEPVLSTSSYVFEILVFGY